MASTFSANLNLELQGTGDHVGTWGGTLNSAALDIVDNAMGDTQAFSLTNVNVTVTTLQSQVANYTLTGTLSGNVIIDWPAIGRAYVVTNSTSGNFTVTLRRNGAGTTVVIPQSRTILIVLLSTGVIQLSDTGVPIGMVSAFAMSTVPTNWLECNGAAISRATYASLFTLIGTTYGVGDGVTTFNVPDLRSLFVRGWAHGAGIDSGRALGSFQNMDIQPHTHTGTTTTNGDHSHLVNLYTGAAGSSTSYAQRIKENVPSLVTNPTSTTGAHNHTFTTNSTGGIETRPQNLAMMYCIRAL